MSILSIVRDYGTNPAIVRMQTDDAYNTMVTPGYLTSQMADFNKINGGAFQWASTDMILCYYLGNWQFFILTPDMASIIPYPDVLPVLVKPSSVLVTDKNDVPLWQGPLTNGQLIIGSTNVTPVANSLTAGTGVTIVNGPGTITISSTGGSGIATINGDAGSVTGGTVTFTGGSTGLTFNGSVATMTVDGILLGHNGGTGVSNNGLTIDLHSGGVNKVLTSDVSGNATWQTPPSSSVPWQEKAGPVAASVDTGYMIIGAATVSLPSGTITGQTIYFVIDTAGSCVITAAGGQFIRLGADVSGSGGTATNSGIGDAITLVYSHNSSTWIADNSVGGGWSIV